MNEKESFFVDWIGWRWRSVGVELSRGNGLGLDASMRWPVSGSGEALAKDDKAQSVFSFGFFLSLQKVKKHAKRTERT